MSIPELEQGITNGKVVEPEVIDQPRFDKTTWLGGATDLQEAEVFVSEDQGHVRIRGLSAGELAFINDQCLVMKGDTMKMDTQQMAVMKFTKGVIEPTFTRDEANRISLKFGPAFNLVVSVIDEISRASDEDIARAKARFRPKR